MLEVQVRFYSQAQHYYSNQAGTKNYIIIANKKKQCAALFVDLSNAIDHEILLNRLNDTGTRDSAIKWFRNDLTEQTQL